jgi:hypothetical protein
LALLLVVIRLTRVGDEPPQANEDSNERQDRQTEDNFTHNQQRRGVQEKMEHRRSPRQPAGGGAKKGPAPGETRGHIYIPASL